MQSNSFRILVLIRFVPLVGFFEILSVTPSLIFPKHAERMPCMCGDTGCPCGIPCYCSDSCGCPDCEISLFRRCRLCNKQIGSTERNICSCFLHESCIPKAKLICDEFQQNWRNAVTDGSDTSSLNVFWMPWCQIEDTNQGSNGFDREEWPADYGRSAFYPHTNLQGDMEYFHSATGNSFNGAVFHDSFPFTFHESCNYNFQNCAPYQSWYTAMNRSYPNPEYRHGTLYYGGMVGIETPQFPLHVESHWAKNLGEDTRFNERVNERKNGIEVSYPRGEDRMDTSSTSSSDSDCSITIFADHVSDPNPIGLRLKSDIPNEARPRSKTPDEAFASTGSVLGKIHRDGRTFRAAQISVSAEQSDIPNGERPRSKTPDDVIASTESVLGKIHRDGRTFHATEMSVSAAQNNGRIKNFCLNAGEMQVGDKKNARIRDKGEKRPIKNTKSGGHGAKCYAGTTPRAMSQKPERTLNSQVKIDTENQTKAKPRLTQNALNNFASIQTSTRPKVREPFKEIEAANATVDANAAIDPNADWFSYIQDWIQTLPEK